MFSLFKKESAPLYPVREKIWKTREAAQKGLLMMALTRLQQNRPALVFTFFEEERQQLASIMKENNINHQELSATDNASEIPRVIFIMDKDALQNATTPDWLKRNGDSFGKSVLFPCHYPIMAEEDKILGQLFGCGLTNFIFCLSFDDPMMASFKKNIVPLMESLGLEENESIEHGMVTNSIKNIRKKINEKVKAEKKARSAEEWYDLNLRS